MLCTIAIRHYTRAGMRLRLVLFLATFLLVGVGVLAMGQSDPTGAERPVAGAQTGPHAAGLVPAPPPEVAAPPGATDPAPTTDSDPETTGPEVRPPVPDRLAGLVADPQIAGRAVGVSVTDAAGRPVFEHQAGASLLPASTQKLLVAAGALAVLGPDFRYETALRATAAPEPGGVLHGDLVLVGSGDPALATPLYGQTRPDRPRTPLEALADRAVAGGITRITGSVLGDARVFPHQPEAPGWLPRYLEEGDTSRSAGLTAEGGRRLFHERGRLRSEPALDPAANAAAALHGLLTDRGIVIDGSAGSSPAPPPAPVVVGNVTSPPLLDLLRFTVQRSDNHLADAIFRTIGAVSGDASWAGSAAATQRALSPLDLDFGTAALADGSGLSRADRLTPAFLTALDAQMTGSNLGSQWQSLMAVAGESGTLQRRLRGSVAERRLRGKTGSLRDVTSLSGVVVGPGTPRYHFALIANDLDGAGKEAVRRLADLLVMVLAEDLYDCRWHQLPPPAGGADNLAVPDRELVCAA